MRSLAIATVLLLACGISAAWLCLWTITSIEIEDSVTLTLVPGEGLRDVARKIEESGLTSSRVLFSLVGQIRGDAARLRAGEYSFSGKVTPRAVFEKLISGQTVSHAFALPDGGTFRQFQALFQNAQPLIDDVQHLKVETLLTDLGVGQGHGEGWFLPDTYHYQRGDTASSILTRAYKAMDMRLLTVWNRRRADIPYRTQRELLIAASIIEKESGRSEDRVRISGVISRRLKKGMRLQVDPTVIYGLGDAFEGNLTRMHLRTRTPYNTYLYRGLPPTPIAAPSAASVEAAAYPDRSRNLYFVARGDGTTEFSETLEEQRKAVRKYQLGRFD